MADGPGADGPGREGVSPQGCDGEQVDYCLTLDGDDVQIGQKRIEDGEMISDKWLVSMKAETFNKLVELWQGIS